MKTVVPRRQKLLHLFLIDFSLLHRQNPPIRGCHRRQWRFCPRGSHHHLLLPVRSQRRQHLCHCAHGVSRRPYRARRARAHHRARHCRPAWQIPARTRRRGHRKLRTPGLQAPAPQICGAGPLIPNMPTRRTEFLSAIFVLR